MYYKIKSGILFRKYKGHGYITDNLEYGYHMLNDKVHHPGERFVSVSGAVMLDVLTRSPKHIDDIVDNLFDIFIGVDRDVLKKDAIEFYDMFVQEGFLCKGETFEVCNNECINADTEVEKQNVLKTSVVIDDCADNGISSNEFLRSIHIDVANACNERCVHCYIPEDCKKNVIDSSLFYKIIDEGRDLNIIHVTLSGGEPLLHRDIINFLKKCREKDLSVNVLSNLTLLTEEIIEEMKKNPLLSVQTSLYSMDEAVHDSITKLSGSFEKTKSGLLRLCSEGIPVQISCPIMKQNKDSYLDVMHWGWEHNISVATEPQIFASYDHSKCNLDNRLSEDEVAEVIDAQLKEGYAQPLREIAIKKEKMEKNAPVCSICRYSFCVTAEGKVFPCAGWQKNIIGDLNNQSVRDIWENSNKIRALREIKRSQFPNCVDCVDRGYCTVCMMWNSNENDDGDPYRINPYRCKIAALTHNKVNAILK